MKPVEMTPEVMDDLERRNLILRLCPGHHELPSKPGQTLAEPVYDSHERYGPHRLMSVTVNRVPFADFGTHPDNEDFILVGDPHTKPLYLAVALMRREQLDWKILTRQLSSEDFICLRVKYNDPEVSFFTMLAEVPHGEATVAGPGRSPSFYVTESRDVGEVITKFGDYELCVEGGETALPSDGADVARPVQTRN